jgi:serralysin
MRISTSTRRALSTVTAGSAACGVLLGVSLAATPAFAESKGGLIGTWRADPIRGTQGPDRIVGGDGDDTIRARGGNDVVLAGAGDDSVRGGDGDDQLQGESGDDVLRGQAGLDTLDGGTGDDLLTGGSQVDTITGGPGYDGIGLSGDPFEGVDVSAAGRTVVNTPDELLDFDPAQDTFVLDRSDLGVDKHLDVANATVPDLTAQGAAGADADVVVVQGAIGNAGAAATAIAGTGVASGPGVFVYFNTTLLINRVVFSADLGDPAADISVLGNVRTLSGDPALAALPTFTEDTFTSRR